MSRKEVWPQTQPHATTPIKYLTENGFNIIRVCDLDRTAQNSFRGCRFLVQREEEPQHEVQVSFGRDLVAQLRLRRRSPVSDDSMFWLVCAESCLANYLWEFDQLPTSDHLAIDELSPEELMLALHWRD